MNYRIRIAGARSRSRNLASCDIPIECIRRTRALNVDHGVGSVSREMYKILKSSNGRKIFTPNHGSL